MTISETRLRCGAFVGVSIGVAVSLSAAVLLAITTAEAASSASPSATGCPPSTPSAPVVIAPVPPVPVIPQVATAADLLVALSKATPGSTIQLVNTTPIVGLAIKGIHIASPGVTITSGNTASPASLNNFTITGSSGITLTYLDLSALGNTANQSGYFQVVSSTDIHFDHDHFHGPLGSAKVLNTAPGLGLAFTSSTNVSVTNTEFSDLYRGLNLWLATTVLVTDNQFHDLQSDGFDIESSGFLTIKRNKFWNFWSGPLDHPDSIQAWTAGTPSASHDILIQDNQSWRAAGGMKQCIFLTDQNDAVNATLNFQNVTVNHNQCIGTMPNVIAVMGGNNVTITNNIVDPYTGTTGWVRTDKLTGVVVDTNNPVVYVAPATEPALVAAFTPVGP